VQYPTFGPHQEALEKWLGQLLRFLYREGGIQAKGRRDYREKRAEAMRMHLKGVPLTEIAESEGSIYKMQDGRRRAAIVVRWTLTPDGKRTLERKVFTATTRHSVAEQLTKALRDRIEVFQSTRKNRRLSSSSQVGSRTQ
jgi:hypothetical protein